MKDKHTPKKRIILADNDPTTGAALSILLEELGMAVDTVGEKEDGRKLMRSHSHDLLIVDLDFPDYKGIELIQAFIQTNPQAEIIALCNKVTSAIYTRMRMLAVMRVLERPVKLQEFRDIIFRALSSNRSIRMMTEKSNISLEIANHLQFLVTLGEQAFFEQVLDICLSEGHEIDLAPSPEDFFAMVQKGFYDVIFSSHEFLLSMHPREMDSLFRDPIKPVLFLIHPDQEVDLGKLKSKFSSIIHLPATVKKSAILEALQKNLPDYIQMRNKAYTAQAHSEDEKKSPLKLFNPISLALNLFGKRVIVFYLILIVIAALVGFMVNQLSEKPPEPANRGYLSNDEKILQQLKELKDMNEQLNR
jgi:CheY-like chemotaxis protein